MLLLLSCDYHYIKEYIYINLGLSHLAPLLEISKILVERGYNVSNKLIFLILIVFS